MTLASGTSKGKRNLFVLALLLFWRGSALLPQSVAVNLRVLADTSSPFRLIRKRHHRAFSSKLFHNIRITFLSAEIIGSVRYSGSHSNLKRGNVFLRDDTTASWYETSTGTNLSSGFNWREVRTHISLAQETQWRKSSVESNKSRCIYCTI
ncbi:hypothetical protein DFH06DRAFT_463972 [Mycena polygramma]|nr:hypothetical protein DFH06DRAFT_463972 [Mycena polygramma]